MALIVIATDFSKIAQNATHYGCELATAQKARVRIVHSFIMPMMFSDVAIPASLLDDAQHDAEDQMNKLTLALRNTYPGISIDGKVTYGNFIDAISDYTDEETKPWLIVIGNSSTDQNPVRPDSTVRAAFKRLTYPVLAVPSAAKFNPISKICFAFDNKHLDGDVVAMEQLNDITKKLKSQLIVLNVQTSAQNIDGSGTIDHNVKKLLADVAPQYTVEPAVVDVNQAIENFILKNSIDWLIMIPRKQSFFEGLFHKSHTKAIAHHLNIPILALHESK